MLGSSPTRVHLEGPRPPNLLTNLKWELPEGWRRQPHKALVGDQPEELPNLLGVEGWPLLLRNLPGYIQGARE